MKKYNLFTLGLTLLLGAMALPASAQVSNDNEDGVYRVDQNYRQDFVPGQVLVKFKDESTVNVRRSASGITVNKQNINDILQEFGALKMEKILPNEKPGRQLRRAKSPNGGYIQERDLSQLYLVEMSEEKVLQTMQLVDKLNTLDDVEFAEPNYKLYLMDNGTIDGFSGGNPYDGSQWYLEDYGVTALWDKPIINSKRPVIAILDTGVDMTHPDLAPNLWTNAGENQGEDGYDNDGNGFKNDLNGWDFINNTSKIRDYNMHGTHVAGIAAAANNNIGIVGANPKAYIMPITVMQSDGTGDVATIVKGIDYAVANGATILNLSLGTYANSRALRQALEKAYQTAVIVAAAGNDGRCINSNHHPVPHFGAAPMFPAAYSFVLGVQALQQDGNLAGFSNYDDDGNTFSSVTTLQDPDGFNYELKAPGTSMLSTIPGGKYKALQGTSMAAPLVAGAISALKMVKQYDTQEILWGDLLHTENIAQAYAVTKRPAELDLMKVLYRERKDISELDEDDYSSDGEIDAGETVSLYPVIRTTFGAASNIQMKLELGDEFEDPNTVEILTPGWVAFGQPLSAYGKSVSMNPMQVRVASNVADNRHIKMKFTAKCDETNTLYEGHFTMVVVNMKKISGLISENTTLTADHIYLVNENIGIQEGATLTIEPGTRLEFEEGMGLSSFGKLVAKGTPEKPIVFTGRHGAKWAGIKSHSSTGEHYHSDALYTNDEKTLFTLLPTEVTPNFLRRYTIRIFYGTNDVIPYKSFSLSNYIDDFSSDFTARQHLLTDPNYLTPAVLQMFSDIDAYCSQYPTERTTDKPTSTDICGYFFGWSTYDNPRDTLSYCKVECFNGNFDNYSPYMKDCVMIPYNAGVLNNSDYPWYFSGIRCNLLYANSYGRVLGIYASQLSYSNIVNNYCGFYGAAFLPKYSELPYNNYFNNYGLCDSSGKYYQKQYWLANNSSSPNINKSDKPAYLGTSREDKVRPYIYEIGNAPNTYGQIDLSNMPDRPYAEAHGIVWKVVVNGKDAQDEYEDLAPLGVGKHKFEVYFNRPMNKNVAPQISFGIREPYTQNAVTEEGEGSGWNAEGTIYTAYKTINGKTKSDGENRIYVWGAEDNEFFEIPYEKSRFNIRINAAGSMATGFMADAGMGKVNLMWNNEENDFEDALGFNIYRYQLDDNLNEINKVCLNQDILDIETTEYTDYSVTPGETYYYMYKVLSTDLKEFDASNVVSATPLTSSLGDANGSGDVDVADVITTVNFAAGMEPKPFIFEAADMNIDAMIDILDVIGIIQKIMNPAAGAPLMAEAVATYTIEDGVLYVESPVDLAGVQVQLSLSEESREKNEEFTVAPDLKGFEHVSAWLSDKDYLFMAYNMSGKTLSAGKHALLNIGDAQIASIRLSNAMGGNVPAVEGETTNIEQIITGASTTTGIYNLHGQRIAARADQLQMLPKGVYIVDGKKVIKWK